MVKCAHIFLAIFLSFDFEWTKTLREYPKTGRKIPDKYYQNCDEKQLESAAAKQTLPLRGFFFFFADELKMSVEQV